jgi:hypothetical protein
MQARVLGLAVFGDAGRDLSGMPTAVDDVAMPLDITVPVREREVELPPGTNKLPLTQGIEDQRRDGNAAASASFLRPNVLICGLPC